MNKPSVNVSGPGVSFFGLLTIVFIVLKLTGHITWSWIWVLCPLWAPAAIGISIFAIFVTLWIWACTRRRY